MPPIALAAVVAIALGGKVIDRPAPHVGVAVTVSAAPSADVLTADLPAPTASFRSDWPAAIRPHAAPPREREEGTDGLMGRLPFGLPNDTPYPTKAPAEDARAEWSKDHAGFDTTPPWVRRLGGLSNFRTDPYER